MDLATARTRATISVPEAGQLLGIGRDASYGEAGKTIPVLRLGRALRVPVPALFRMLGLDPAELDHQPLRPVNDRALDPETTPDAEAGSSTEPATATIHAFARPKTGVPDHGAVDHHRGTRSPDPT